MSEEIRVVLISLAVIAVLFWFMDRRERRKKR